MFIHFFKTDYHFNTLPECDLTKLLSYLVLRYAINSILSLGIIYTLFQNIQFIKLASLLYLGAFFLLIILLLILLLNLDSNWYYLFFNVSIIKCLQYTIRSFKAVRETTIAGHPIQRRKQNF